MGVNCIRSFPASGQVIWGARTLRGADALGDDYKYLSVRRLALYLGGSIYRGAVGGVRAERRAAVGAESQHRMNLTNYNTPAAG